MRVKKRLLKFISTDIDPASRLKIAKGEDRNFRALPPEDRITLLFIISHEIDPDLAGAASETLDDTADAAIISALKNKLDILVLRDLFVRFRDNVPILTAIASNEGMDDRLAYAIAKESPVEALNAFISNPRLSTILSSILEGLGKNPLVDNALAARLEATAEELSESMDIAGAEHEEEDVENVISTEEGFDSDRFNVYQALCKMTAGEKIKLAHTGDRSVRNLLIKDNNRVVALSVLKNPKLTEQEVVRTISSTSISEEIIREIANSRQWMKCYNVKCAMAFNPHTPLSFSLKIVDYLRDRELKQLAKSKGIPGALVNAAIRKLKLKKR